MKIAYNLTAQDFVNFQEYYMKKKSPLAGCLQPVIFATLLANVILGLGLYFYQGLTTYTYICLICIFLLGLLLIARGQQKKNLIKAAQQMEKDKPGAFGNMTMEFFEDGVKVQSTTNHKFLEWNEIEKVDSNKNYFFIYSKKGMVYIIPKRSLEYPDDEFSAFLNKYIPKT